MWSRSSTRAWNVSVAAIGKLHLDLAVLELAHDLEAGVGEDIRASPGSPRGPRRRSGSIAGAGRAVGELLEQARADPAALLLVGDREGDLGRRRVAQAHVVRDAPRSALASPSASRASAPRSTQSGSSSGSTSCASTCADAVEAQVEAAFRQALEEREQRVRIGCGRRPQPERAAVLRMTSAAPAARLLDAKRQAPLLHGRAARSTPAGPRARP